MGRLGAQALDVEGTTASDVEDAVEQLGGAACGGWGSGGPCRPPSPAPAPCRTTGTRWASATRRRPSGRSASTGPRISGITSPALRRITVSPGADVLALDLVRVVQRGALDGRAGDLGRLHHAERRHPAGAAGVDLDGEQLGVDLLGRVLVGDRPPGRPARRAQPALEADVVDLDHDAVDLVLDVVAVLAVVLDELLHRLETLDDLGPVAGRQAPGRQGGVGLRLCPGLEARACPDAVADHAQRTGGGDLGVLLAQRAGGGVAGVGEHRLAGVDHRLVEPLEGLHRAGTPRRAPPAVRGVGNSSLARSRWGIESMVFTLGVTSSPVRPSPRVSARTSRPSS